MKNKELHRHLVNLNNSNFIVSKNRMREVATLENTSLEMPFLKIESKPVKEGKDQQLLTK